MVLEFGMCFRVCWEQLCVRPQVVFHLWGGGYYKQILSYLVYEDILVMHHF